MTNAQIQLLKKCIFAFRFQQDDDSVDDLVEVGSINGVDTRTAKSLVEAGILVYDMPRNSTIHTNSHVRFPTLKELNEIGDCKWQMPSTPSGEN